MAGLFAHMAAGAAQGVGNNIVEEGKAKRDAQLRLLEMEQRFGYERSLLEERNKFTAGENEKDRASRGDMIQLGDGTTGVRVGTTVEPLLDAQGKPVSVRPKDPDAPEVKEFYDEQGRPYKAQWDPGAREWVKVGGSKAGDNGVSMTMPDGTVVQVGGSKPLTEGQSKDTVFSTRAAGALPIIDKHGDKLTSLYESTAGKTPVVGNYMKSDEYQQAEQAGREFLQAILRKDTGAAITPQEMIDYGSVYIPQPGDGEAVLKQKEQSRKRALAAIEAGMPPQAILNQERALQETDGPDMGADDRVKAGAPAPGVIEEGFEFLGGDPADPKNWRPVS